MIDGISLGVGKALAKSKTGLALLVHLSDDNREIWIPLSAIHDDSEVFELGGEGKVIVAERWADQKGLSASREQVKQ